jgi:hypothetical protein
VFKTKFIVRKFILGSKHCKKSKKVGRNSEKSLLSKVIKKRLKTDENIKVPFVENQAVLIANNGRLENDSARITDQKSCLQKEMQNECVTDVNWFWLVARPWRYNENRVARFFLVHDAKIGKMYQMVTKYPKCL